MPDLEMLLERLIRQRVSFVVVGGFAAVAHGATLVTQDIDVCCSFTAPNLLRLQKALIDLHPVHRMTPAKLPLQLTKTNIRGFKNFYLDTDLGQLDCLSEISGVGNYRVVRQRSKRVKLASGYCYILNIDALIEAKQALHRPRDREAVLQLKLIRERNRHT